LYTVECRMNNSRLVMLASPGNRIAGYE
jgi:hypothetical protein